MPRYRSTDEDGTLPRRTLDYLRHGATEGRRNAELFDAACQFRDAGRPAAEAEEKLLARALADGLAEAEARHSILSAYARHARDPVTPGRRQAPVVPPPAVDGFARLLEACFQDNEFVALAPASESDEGETVPRRGVTLTAAEWKAKAAARGGIDKCFGTKLGLFIRINPMCRHGARNEDVAAFRHVLVEFDKDGDGNPVPKEDQYRAVVASGLPVAALIDSGNKSLHAWVRVDAPDEKEYKRRVGLVWKWFEGMNLDRQNRNPSRLSRCPEGWRTVDGEARRQNLLATGLGAESWAAWEASHDAPGGDDMIRISRLSAYDTTHDPNNVLGRRWLCRGGSLVVVGQSGVGKSSLCMQLMILWALGRHAFGITPARPLRSVLVQAENDEGDLAEMYQGVRKGMGLTPEEEAVLEERVFIYRDTTRVGADFVASASALVDRHKPDLVWADPLLNYIGDEISEQRVISEFCCRMLNAVSLRTGVIWCLLHHTGKPSKDPKATSHWTASDLAYSGLGSSALVNWARETAVLVRLKTAEGEPPTFQLSMTKRRTRAGLVDEEGMPTDTVFLRHSDNGGICWEKCPMPVVVGDKAKTGSYKPGRKSGFDPEKLTTILAAFGGEVTASNVSGIADKLAVAERTVWRWWKRLKTNDL